MEPLPILSTIISWENDLLSKIRVGQPIQGVKIHMASDGVEVGTNQIDRSWAGDGRVVSGTKLENFIINEQLKTVRQDLVNLIHGGEEGGFSGLRRWLEFPDLSENIQLIKEWPFKLGFFELFLKDLWLRARADLDRGEWAIIINPIQAETLHDIQDFTHWENGRWYFVSKRGWRFQIIAERVALLDQLILVNTKALSWHPRNGDVKLTHRAKGRMRLYNLWFEPVGLVIKKPRQNLASLMITLSKP